MARLTGWRGIQSLLGRSCLRGALQSLNVRASVAPWKVSSEEQEEMVLQSLLSSGGISGKNGKSILSLAPMLSGPLICESGKDTEPDSHPLEDACIPAGPPSIALLHARIYFCSSGSHLTNFNPTGISHEPLCRVQLCPKCRVLVAEKEGQRN